MYGVGTEPDPRFSLANERTALAWIRTGLALIAGGLALTSVAYLTDQRGFLDLMAVLACLSGGATSVNALVTWRRTERALRTGRPLPAPTGVGWLVAIVAIAAAVIAGYAIVQL